MKLSHTKARVLSKALMATGLVCAILFILSTRLSLGVLVGSHHAITSTAGLVSWRWSISDWSTNIATMSHFGPLFLDRNDDALEWWPTIRDSPASGELSFPLIYPMLGMLIPGIYLAYRHRFRPGCCKRCGYDLAGLPTNVPCPECGRARPSA